MFGAPAASNTTSSPFSFGASSTSTAPKPSLFGAPASSTSLFGQTPAASNPQQPSTSLFGQPAQQSSQQPSTSLFGSSTQSQGASLFGAPKPASPAPSGGLFGSSQPQQSQSLFGSTSNPPPAQQQSTSLFGQTQSQQQNSSSLFGQPSSSQSPQPQPQQGQQAGLHQSQAGGQQGGITKTTKFTELPAEAQRLIEGIDSFINQQISLSHSLSQHPLSATSTSYSPSTPTIPQTSNLLKRLITETTSLTHNLNNSVRHIQELQKRVTLDGEDAVRGARIMDASKTPQGRQTLRGQAKFPHEYFTRLTENMSVRVTTYQNAMNQLSQTLSSLLPSSSSSYNPSHPLSTSSHQPPTPTQISQTLQTHQLLLQRLAAQIAFLDEEVSALKDEFRVLWRERGGGGGSVRDVFDREREGRRDEELRVEELGRSMRL